MSKKEVLQLVKAVVDPEKGSEERQNAFDALTAMIKTGPDVAMTLFDPCCTHDELFDSFLHLISSSDVAESEHLLSILKMVVGEIGISMPHFRKTLLLAFSAEGWTANAVQILQMMLSLLNMDPGSHQISSSFWLEGCHTGIFLGGSPDWMLNEGYTMEAKVWKENCPGNSETSLFAVLSSEDYQGRESFLIRVHLKSSRVMVTIGDKAAAQEYDSGLVLPSCVWCKITISHHHDKRIMKPSQLIVAVDDKVKGTAIRYPSAMGRLRVYFGCSGYQSSLQGSDSFRGLARDIHFWPRAFSAHDIQSAEGSDLYRNLLVQPFLAASAGSLPFLFETMQTCSELPALDSNSRCLGDVRVPNNYHAVQALENLGGMKILLLLLLCSFRIPHSGRSEILVCAVLDMIHNFLLLTESFPVGISEGGEGHEWFALVSCLSFILFELPLECRTRRAMERICKITRTSWDRSRHSASSSSASAAATNQQDNLPQLFVKLCLLSGREWTLSYQEEFSGCLLEYVVGWSRSDPELLLHVDDIGGILLRLSAWHACKESPTNDCHLCVQIAECCCNLLAKSSEVRAQLEGLKTLLVGRMANGHICKLALLTFSKYLEHYIALCKSTPLLPPCPAELSTIAIFIMRDRKSFDQIFAISLNVIVLNLISSSPETKKDFESSGGYKALQMNLCSRSLDAEQQDTCVHSLFMLIMQERIQKLQDYHSIQGQFRDAKALDVLLAFLEVCCKRVRKLAVNNISNMLRSSESSCMMILNVPSWPDRFLNLIHGIGEQEASSSEDDLFPSVDSLFSRIVSSMAGTEQGNSAMQEIFFAFGRYRGSIQEMAKTDFEMIVKTSAWRILGVIVDRVLEGQAGKSTVIAGGAMVYLYCNIFLHFTEENRVRTGREADEGLLSSSRPWRETCLLQFEEVQRRHDRAGGLLLQKLLRVMKKLLEDLERQDNLNAAVFCSPEGTESSSPLFRPSRWSFCLFSLTLSMVLHEVQEALDEDSPPHLLANLKDHLVVLELSCRLRSDSNDRDIFATAAVVALFEQCKDAVEKLADEGEEGEGAGPMGSRENLKSLIHLLAARAIALCQYVDQPMMYNLFAGHAQKSSAEDKVVRVEKEGGLEVLHAPLEGGLAAFSEYYGGEEEEDPRERRDYEEQCAAAPADVAKETGRHDGRFEEEEKSTAQQQDAEGKGREKPGEEKVREEKENLLQAFERIKWSLPEVVGHIKSSDQQLHRMSAGWRVMWNEKIVQGERQVEDESLDANLANNLKSSFEMLRGRCSKSESLRSERAAEEQEDLKIRLSCDLNKVVNMVETNFCQLGDSFCQLCVQHGIFNTNALHLSRLRLDFKENSRRQRHILTRNDEFEEYKRRDVAKLEKVEKKSLPTILKESVAKILSLAKDQKAAEGYESTEDVDSGEEKQQEQVEFDDDDWTDVALREEGGAEEEEPVKMEKGLHLLLMECSARMITVSGICHGAFLLFSSSISFRPDPSRTLSNFTMRDDESSLKRMMQKTFRWALSDLTDLYSRRYMHRTSALELFFLSQPPVLFDFSHIEASPEGGEEAKCAGGDRSFNQAKRVYKEILKQRKQTSLRRNFFRNPKRALLKYKLQEMWVNRLLSNFEYLMLLNSFAGRSYNDLTQYPVFPWILQDYTSENLDLEQASSFRDLSKPIGAQQEQQVAKLQERFEGMRDVEQQPFHYGTHYSTPGYVLWYLIRLEPFTRMAVHLQGGHFDVPDRLFWSVGETFKNCTTSINDVKELVPEFYYLPEFLINRAAQDFGVTQSRGQVSHVVLPPWANNDSVKFVHTMSMALESEHVSRNLHQWIDLIFGFKQQGAEAIKATNVFHFLSYENQVDLDRISNPEERKAVEAQIADYGQTPRQLFRTPHPRRKEGSAVPKPILYDILLFRGLIEERRRNSTPVFGAFTSFPIASSEPGSPGLILGGMYGNLLLTVSVDGVLERWVWDANASFNGRPFKAEKVPDARKVSPLQAAKSMAKGVKGFMQTGDLPSLSSIFSASRATLAPLLGGGGAWGFAHATCICLPRSPGPRCEELLIFQCGLAGGEVCVYTCSASAPPRKSQTKRLHWGCVTCLAASERPNGLFDVHLITGGADGCVKIWKLLLKQSTLLDRQVKLSNAPIPVLPVAVLQSHTSPVTCLSVCMPMDLIVDGSSDGTMTMHRMSTSEYVRTIKYSNKLKIEIVKMMENGNLLAYSSKDNALRVYALTGEEIASLSFGPSFMTCLTASSCGNYVFAGESTGSIRILEVPFLADLQALSPTNSSAGRVDFITLSPCNNFLLCGYRSGYVELVTDKGQLFEQKKKALEDLGIYGLL